MRFSQANWITIDDAARSLTCGRCGSTIDLSGESFGVLGFVRTVSRLARQHFSCPDPGRDYSTIEARRQQAIAREMAAVMESEGEQATDLLVRGHVVPISASRQDLRVSGVAEDAPLCRHCLKRRTESKLGICGQCGAQFGYKNAVKWAEMRERAASVGVN